MCKDTHGHEKSLCINTPTVKLMGMDALAELKSQIWSPQILGTTERGGRHRFSVALTATHFDSVQLKVNSTWFSNI